MVDDDKKVSFDARLAYHDVVKEALQLTKRSAIMGDITLRFRCLRTLYTMVRSYVKSVDRDRIDKLVADMERQVSRINGIGHGFKETYTNKLWNQSFDLESQIHEAAKEFFLPMHGDDDDEVDWDAIARAS